jgi:hypothetical protein
MWDFSLEIAKALAVEAIKWAAVGIVAWVGTNFPAIRRTIGKTGISRSAVAIVIAAVAISGFLNGAFTVAYNYYEFARLADWGGEPSDAPKSPANINGGYGPVTATCPKGSYVVGVTNYGNRAPPYCIGCFVAVQVLCRKLNS